MGREHLEIIQAADIEWSELPAADWPAGAHVRVLSCDPASDALTAVVSLPAGYRRGPGAVTAAMQVLVLTGTLRIGEATRTTGFYEYTPAGAAQGPWTVQDACELLLLADGRPNFVPGRDGEAPVGRIAIDTERMRWTRGRVPGPPPGLFSKTLRHDETTGARTFMCGSVPRYDYPMIEYHDCAEEAYHIGGDIRMGTSGEMVAGSYFWRPPYISHGPFYSRQGMIALLTIDGPLVNHFVDDPRRTIEENRAEAKAQGPPPDYFARGS